MNQDVPFHTIHATRLLSHTSHHHSFFTHFFNNNVSPHVLCAANRHSEAMPYVAFLESRDLYFFDRSVTNAEMQVIGEVCAMCWPMTFKVVVS
jgi:hypothetical protein